MRIVGLDLSMTATGICLADGRTSTVRTNAKHGDGRLVHIKGDLYAHLTEDRPDLVVTEEAPPGLRGNAIKALHMVHGAVRSLLLELDVPYVVVNGSALRAYATGRSGADKAAMILAAYKRSGTEFIDDNQCDAWWLRHAGMDHYGQPEFVVPVAQRTYLDKVDWPSIG